MITLGLKETDSINQPNDNNKRMHLHIHYVGNEWVGTWSLSSNKQNDNITHDHIKRFTSYTYDDKTDSEICNYIEYSWH